MSGYKMCHVLTEVFLFISPHKNENMESNLPESQEFLSQGEDKKTTRFTDVSACTAQISYSIFPKVRLFVIIFWSFSFILFWHGWFFPVILSHSFTTQWQRTVFAWETKESVQVDNE